MVAFACSLVFGAEPLRNQGFDCQAGKFFLRIAKEVFRLLIGQDNPTALVHHEHSVGSRLDNEAELFIPRSNRQITLELCDLCPQSFIFLLKRHPMIQYELSLRINTPSNRKLARSDLPPGMSFLIQQ